MKNTSIYDNLVLLAAREAGVNTDEICCSELSISEGLYHVRISTAFQKHECIIEPESMELLGMISEPSGDYIFDINRHFCA